MPKRVKQHQIEDLSRSKYSLAIPKSWVFRDKPKDYGIDAEVEIFEENGKATGLFYWVQLKATESNFTSGAKHINLTIEAINYYKSLDLPVLIARYSEAQDCFYCKWAHEIDLFFAKKHAKTMRVSFTPQDLWNTDSPNRVKEYLEKLRDVRHGRLKFPMPLNIIVKNATVKRIPKGVILSSLREALNEYPQFIRFSNDLKDVLFNVSLSTEELIVGLLSLTGCTFHNVSKREDQDFVTNIVADILIGCAFALARIGQREMAAQIILDDRLKTRCAQKKEVLTSLMPDILKTSHFGDAIDFVTDLIATEKDNLLEIIIMMSTLWEANPRDQEKMSQIEVFLRKCLEKYISLGENPLIGISYYNLGNHYRSRKLFRKAITHYLKARRYEKKYLDQSYYYQELAGALFMYKKYHFSATLYKMALDRGAPKTVKPLWADALMLSGKYKAAVNVFSDYLSSTKDHEEVWHLECFCLKTLVDKTGVEEQIRHTKDAIAAVDMKKADKEGFVESLDFALDLDMLCSVAWFNLGVAQSRGGNHLGAAFSFTMCAIVDTGDIEAWVNAALCSMNKEVPASVLGLTVRVAYLFNGDRFLSRLYKEFNGRFDSETILRLTDWVEKIVSDAKPKEDKPIVRFMGKDGMFRDIREVPSDGSS